MKNATSLRVDVLEGARIAVFSLRANRLRTVLTTLGIGIGVATLLAIVGIIQGLNTSFHRQLASFGANTLYVSKFPWMIKGDWWKYRNRKNFTLEQLPRLRAMAPFITAMSPSVSRLSDVSYGGEQMSSVRIQGVNHEYLGIAGFDITGGRFITESDEEVTRPVAVLGADVAERLFPGISPVGRSIRVDNRSFQVVGTLSRKGKVVNESMDLLVLIPFKTFYSNFGKGRPFEIAMAVADASQVRMAEDQLIGILRRLRGTEPGQPDDFNINKPEAMAQTYAQLTGALYGVAVGVGLITLLVGGIGIMNIMLVSVRERTREIGVRRALGARKRTIVVQFLMEAASVSAVGGLLGTTVGLGTAKVVSLITPLAADVQTSTVLGGVFFAALVGLLFGIWPAARAANLDPVEALRYE
ncbi:ABC transporter permease [Myxococcus sp. CA051A]|uniref:FtsX-like permease family protein n=1 Tax=Myxococcus llanfairpwllgwyngyllgogerychwyrndrobwllllantysiliogogogochensis TaxID=2590453 RepID=A0A540X051_9BACT|nr:MULTISPECIES: ABC transporter permease [Myxococcus]NTX36983.1 ABC transporter permease [Myxococcus sp. CA033]NTX51390.1 ABC transporter permease [Myxococcus sp. CA039A]NTX64094.1 ABC transporter permease [Myxococcus sp. CA051A]TQF14573.1 FtsX-like permease family protein [Myxococcus llanfairpwllgwyngyllgogerychwyrndrobwllllantysiliogogogochensis]